jgi:hypothetical protein
LSKDDNFPHLVGGADPQIVDKPPTIFHLDPKADARHKIDAGRLFATYRKGLNPDRTRLLDRFVMKDIAFKAVGVGSVGTFCCIRTLKNRRLGGVSELSEGKDLGDYAQLCGKTLARAHARSGEPALIAGYLGKSEVIDNAIASFAMAYADQTVADHAALVKAKSTTKASKLVGAKPVATKKTAKAA